MIDMRSQEISAIEPLFLRPLYNVQDAILLFHLVVPSIFCGTPASIFGYFSVTLLFA